MGIHSSIKPVFMTLLINRAIFSIGKTLPTTYLIDVQSFLFNYSYDCASKFTLITLKITTAMIEYLMPFATVVIFLADKSGIHLSNS